VSTHLRNEVLRLLGYEPPGFRTISQKGYGDPVQNPTLQPYREITITRTPNATNGTESTREITRDRDTSGSLVITSDLSATYGFYKHGDPVKLAETQHTGTGSELTSTWTYYTAAADPAAFNKPATLRRSDGQWANYTYQGSPVTGILLTKTVSGWLDQAAPAIGTAPNEAANRVVVEIEAKNETGTFSREEKIQGVLVSKTWGERYKDNSGQVIEKSRVETGIATLTTTRTAFPSDAATPVAQRGRMKSVENPDGTLSLYAYALQGENRVETIDSGSGTLSGVTDGTRTVSTYTKDDTLIKEVVSDIASGVILSTRQAIAFDANDQPTRWAYDNDPDDYSETLNGCCGIDSERSRDGILTTYTRDGLKRPKTAISQGITLTYTYGKKTIGSTDFPSVSITATAGSLTLNQGSTVYDHAGNVIQQISPDLNGDGNEEITATTHDFSTRTTTVTNPDGGTIVSTAFADGQSKSTAGTAVPDSSESLAVGTDLDGISGAVIKTTTTRPSNTAAGDQVSTTYQAIGGLTLAAKLNGVTTVTYGYDNLARPVLVTDGDGVKQHTAYNAKGEAYLRATSRDGNNTIDPGTDTVSETQTDVADIPGFGPAIRSVSKVWTDANTSVVTSTTLRSPDGTKTSTTTLGIGNPSTSLSASHLDRADGSWTDTTTNPDGTKFSITYQNWLPLTSSRHDTANNVIESTTTLHDDLRRSWKQTHSRTGEITTNYSPTNGQVSSIDDHGRVTSFKYDSMGNRVETTLPDNTKTHTVFSDSGQLIISWGSQTYPIYNTYDEQDRRLTLRTNPTLTTAGVPTNAGGSLTTWIYHPNGLLQQKQDDAGEGASYTYTDGGRLHTRTWARGVVTTYGYTASGLRHTVFYSNEPAGQTTPNLEFTYDILGRQDTVKRGGVLHADYDYRADTLALDKEKLQIDTLNQTLTRTYETGANGTLAGRSNGYSFLGGSATWAYDNAGRLATITDGTDTFGYGYRYTVNGALHEGTTGTGTFDSTMPFTLTGPKVDTSLAYEATRDILAYRKNDLAAGTLSKFTYSVNNIGQRESVATTGTAFAGSPANWTWGYDSLGQVTSADSPTFVNDRGYLYDAIGNRRGIRIGAAGVPKESDGSISPGQGTLIYASNPLNQYTTVPQVPSAPSFDLDGNMTAGPVAGAAGANVGIPVPANAELTWDAENRLVKAVVGEATINYTYDHLSRLISRSVGVSPTTATHYLYDGWNRIAEYSGTTLETTYLWGMDLSGTMQGAGGVGGLLSVKSGSAVHYPAFDGNGNVSEYLDGNGAVAAHFEYDPFGNLVVDSQGNAAAFPYRFSTKPQDPTTGLYYYGYRYYDPVTGRWPSRDPIEEEGGINLYGFVGNDSVARGDILGLFDTSVQVGVRLSGDGVANGGGIIKRWQSGRLECTGRPMSPSACRWIPGKWVERDATTAAGVKLQFEVVQGYTVNCTTNQITQWQGTANVTGVQPSIENEGAFGPIQGNIVNNVDTSSARASGPMNPQVTLSPDGKTKTIKFQVDATAVVEISVSFGLGGQVEIKKGGWTIGAGFKTIGKSRVDLKGTGYGTATCTCDPKTGKF
jgi:RHS repeat-associated protein